MFVEREQHNQKKAQLMKPSVYLTGGFSREVWK
nr:MAG TPA: hypothetical protein [Caudoviricetes sp.]